MVIPVSLDKNTWLQKNVKLFHLFPLRSLQKDYIKGLKPFYLDPKAENTHFGLQAPYKTTYTQNQQLHDKTN